MSEMMPSPFAIPKPPRPQNKKARIGEIGVRVRATKIPMAREMMPATSCFVRNRVIVFASIGHRVRTIFFRTVFLAVRKCGGGRWYFGSVENVIGVPVAIQ